MKKTAAMAAMRSTKVVGLHTGRRCQYKGDKDASAKLQNKVKRGGAHVWGDIVMPPNVLASDADIKTLATGF